MPRGRLAFASASAVALGAACHGPVVAHDRLFVAEDPHAKLKKVPAKTVKLIEQGAVEPGMTREQVLMALGYPPAHRTPALEASPWHYWQNRWHQFLVVFDGTRVVRVQP
jgi:outer membrane protein assembly factor BamE (lipoprotein component of BamABCDE complex)